MFATTKALVTQVIRWAFAMLGSATIGACASPTEISHQNFKHIMQLDVGRSVDDPYNYRNQYPNRRFRTGELVNGNVEEGFRSGRGHRCAVFFESDKTTRKIVAWRYEGTKEDCAIVP